MATSDEILKDFTDSTLYIDLETREISIPEHITNLGVESDDDVKRLTFSLPRYYNDIDLSTFAIRVNYLNAKKEGDLFEVSDPVIEDENIKFDWIVGRNALAYKGTATFNVCLKNESGDEVLKEFNTTIATLPVLQGLETGEEVIQEYADILLQWENQLFGVGDTAEREIILKGSEVIDAVEAAGEEQRRLIILKGDEVLETITTEETAITDASTEAQRQITLKASDVLATLDEQVPTAVSDYMTEHSAEFKGEKGDAFTYSDFTEEQLAALKGEKGDAFTYSDFTEEQLAALKGEDGYSPTLSETKEGKVTTVTVTDVNGIHTFEISDGADGKAFEYSDFTAEQLAALKGEPGGDGLSPELSESRDGDVTTVTVTDVNGTHAFTLNDGHDGVSPTVSISKSGKVTTVTITDATGDHVFEINDGVDGSGSGDMVKATYDADGDGIVDDAAKLGGKEASYYTTLVATDDGNGNVILSIGG